MSEDEAKYFLNGEEAVDIEQFVSDSWSNIKPYLMMDAGIFKPPADEAEGLENEAEGEEEPASEQEQDGKYKIKIYFIGICRTFSVL